jgi:hypothetical protein
MGARQGGPSGTFAFCWMAGPVSHCCLVGNRSLGRQLVLPTPRSSSRVISSARVVTAMFVACANYRCFSGTLHRTPSG